MPGPGFTAAMTMFVPLIHGLASSDPIVTDGTYSLKDGYRLTIGYAKLREEAW